jgi:hypothetical protein
VGGIKGSGWWQKYYPGGELSDFKTKGSLKQVFSIAALPNGCSQILITQYCGNGNKSQNRLYVSTVGKKDFLIGWWVR